MKYFFLAFKKWNDINGRANLREFWYFVLFSIIFSFLISFFDVILLGVLGKEITDNSLGILGIIYSILIFIPNITITVRRPHDVNKSGWNLLRYITIIGGLFILILNVLKGTAGDNKYGPPSNA